METREKVIPIVALRLPPVCTPATSRIEVSNFPPLHGFNHADSVNSSNMHIDILFGTYFYHNFVTGEIIKENMGPLAVNSKLGWLLSSVTIVMKFPVLT